MVIIFAKGSPHFLKSPTLGKGLKNYPQAPCVSPYPVPVQPPHPHPTADRYTPGGSLTTHPPSSTPPPAVTPHPPVRSRLHGFTSHRRPPSAYTLHNRPAVLQGPCAVFSPLGVVDDHSAALRVILVERHGLSEKGPETRLETQCACALLWPRP